MTEKDLNLKEEQLDEVNGGTTHMTPESAIHAINNAISNHDAVTARQIYKISKHILSESQKNELIKAFYKEFKSNIEQ